jgi:hypothetical protein
LVVSIIGFGLETFSTTGGLLPFFARTYGVAAAFPSISPAKNLPPQVQARQPG